jgi:ribosomal-protein-alanine N-acetyltransferase
MQQPELITPRLRLRPFVPTDAAAVQELAGEFRIADTTLMIPHPYPDGAAESWIETHEPAWRDGIGASHAITLPDDGRLVGAVGLTLIPAHAVAELGYWIAVDSWGKGYATEGASALCTFAFDALRVHRIQARHLVRNPASGRVMQKLGMQYEGTLRGVVRKWDVFEDLALYAVLAPDWPTSRPPLPSRPG